VPPSWSPTRPTRGAANARCCPERCRRGATLLVAPGPGCQREVPCARCRPPGGPAWGAASRSGRARSYPRSAARQPGCGQVGRSSSSYDRLASCCGSRGLDPLLESDRVGGGVTSGVDPRGISRGASGRAAVSGCQLLNPLSTHPGFVGVSHQLSSHPARALSPWQDGGAWQ
jgi:hypothetical protein